jgi:hypothetical protein
VFGQCLAAFGLGLWPARLGGDVGQWMAKLGSRRRHWAVTLAVVAWL